MLTLYELLKPRGLQLERKTKLVRHMGSHFDLYRLYINDQIELYQTIQSKPVFSNCEQIISFIGLQGSLAKFLGVYEVSDWRVEPGNRWPEDYLYPTMPCGDNIYTLTRNPAFDDLAGRLVIDWGPATRSWYQWAEGKDKEVLEVLPKGYVRVFPGYLDFILDYKELCELIAYPAANREWHHKLAEVAGIYLITDASTGRQYVGSAYGTEGVLGRWRTYAQTGHGDNLLLKALLENHPDHARHFRFTLLRTLPKSLTPREVISFERLYKEKLGSRTFGLNSN